MQVVEHSRMSQRVQSDVISADTASCTRHGNVDVRIFLFLAPQLVLILFAFSAIEFKAR
jgi:hypothetical protein